MGLCIVLKEEFVSWLTATLPKIQNGKTDVSDALAMRRASDIARPFAILFRHDNDEKDNAVCARGPTVGHFRLMPAPKLLLRIRAQ
jgi:hypothetical protein